MEEAHSAAAVVELVGLTKRVLERADRAEVADADVDALRGHLGEISRLLAEFELQQVVVLSSKPLMDAGIALYNAPRAAFRLLEAAESGAGSASAAIFPRYLLVLSRLSAAKIMSIALSWSKSEEGQGDGSARSRTSFMDECVDVMRCFGRVGMSMLESASIDCSACRDYLKMAKQAFALFQDIWAGVGLSYLTKIKQGTELDEILDDLWDFCMDRVRVLKLLLSDPGATHDNQEMIESVYELQMLVPYRLSSVNDLLELLTEVIDTLKVLDKREQQVAFTEEALRVCDAIETFGDDTHPHLLDIFRRQALTNMLASLCAVQDIERSEACYSLLAGKRNPDAQLCMALLYVDARVFDKALHFLRLLFQQDNAGLSIQGTRAYIQKLGLTDEALKIYEELERNYGDRILEIKVDLACVLALSENRRGLAIGQIKQIAGRIDEMNRRGETPDSLQVARLQQAVFDAVQYTTNLGLDEECIEWASTGILLSSSPEDSAAYLRMLARAYAKLGRFSEAESMAEQALSADATKKSLFVLLQVELASGEQDKVQSLIEDLKARDDFECVDLLLVAKEIETSRCKDDLEMIKVLESVCELAVNDTSTSPQLPLGVLLQNLASLVFQDLKQTTVAPKQGQDSPYSSKFANYAGMLLKASRQSHNAETFGPSAVFEWFYSMCFNIAKSTEKSTFFVLAADIAAMSDEMYLGNSPLAGRSLQCLLAAISSNMKRFDELGRLQLEETLKTIMRYDASGVAVESEVSSYLAKATVAIKIRLLEPDTDALFVLCREKLPRHVHEFLSIGELAAHAVVFDEANQIRKKYQHLARCLFRYGLQVMLQEQDQFDPSTLGYLVRRLILLSDSHGDTLEWFEQLIQLHASLDLRLPNDDVEWFAGKAWNIGVSCLRTSQRESSQWFMKTALVILGEPRQMTTRRK